MRIDIENPIRKAFDEGCDGYVPVFRDLELGAEGGFPDVSLSNLLKLVNSGLEVHRVEVGQNRNVLVTFTTGECYLATGFSVGYDGEEVSAFSKFLASIGWGKQERIMQALSGLPENWVDPIDKTLWGQPGPRIHAVD